MIKLTLKNRRILVRTGIREYAIHSTEGNHVQNKELSMRLTALDELVGELTCDCPKPDTLRAQMNHLGIEYCDDPAERMSRVLFLIQKIQFDYTRDLPEFESAPMKTNDRNKKVRKDGIEI